MTTRKKLSPHACRRINPTPRRSSSRFHGAAAKRLEALALNDDNKDAATFARLVRTFGIDSAKAMTASGAERLAEQWTERQAARLAGKKGGTA